MEHQYTQPIREADLQNSPNLPGAWVPLMEFALKQKLSVSTVRRYIKAHRVSFRIEQGRYLLWDPHPVSALEVELAELRHELQKAREEAVELKMLIALYEQDSKFQAVGLI